MKDQRIRDPIHNLIAFSAKSADDQVLWELLQTLPIQRLRRIKQLGFSEFVYPGATHSRFSHVLGAMQMARRMLDVFERNSVYHIQSIGYFCNNNYVGRYFELRSSWKAVAERFNTFMCFLACCPSEIASFFYFC